MRLRDLGSTEVGGFGISSASDLLLIEDVCLVRQRCTAVTVKFNDESVADFFDQQVDLGRRPEQLGRVWIHTHPGNSADPSNIDEETFARCFGGTDWAVMFILARGGRTYARLRFGVGPGGQMELPVDVDFEQPFPAADPAAWQQEYQQSVVVEELLSERPPRGPKPRLTELRDENEWLLADPFFSEARPDDPFWSTLLRDDVPYDPFLEYEHAPF